MAEQHKPTIFQRLNTLLFGNDSGVSSEMTKYNSPNTNDYGDTILFSTNDKNEYERKLAQYKQQKLLSYQWVKANNDSATDNLPAQTAVKLMYRDADLMDGTPEIGAALDVISDEATTVGSDGQMLHIYSKSKRIKSILEDLFYNRLNIHLTLPMIARALTKYGNEYMLLNIDKDNGVKGWRQLPVHEMTRVENGFSVANAPYAKTIRQVGEQRTDETLFIWEGHNESMPYKKWQVAHFRLLNDSFYLPYGCSHLHKARRAWRMWSMMEDAMLIYRLDKSVERRVFKIYVGAIDDQDVPAFIQKMANNFKRTPIIDPQTGQVDLRKNFLDTSTDFFIPVRDPNAPTPIEALPSAQNATSMDDLQYMQNKILSALRVPKQFLNFQDPQGKGQNLALGDIRFARMITRIQQYLILELNKIAIIHLYILGLTDDMTNFALSLNNPSAQIEATELEDTSKRIQTLQTALSDPGNGIPVMSLHMGLKKIMKMSDAEIKDMLNEIRLEKAIAAELQMTSAIIKKTGTFDKVDRIYGDYEALMHPEKVQAMATNQDMMGGSNLPGGGMMGAGGGLLGGESLGSGSDLDFGSEGFENGNEGLTDMQNAPNADQGLPVEALTQKRKPLLNERHNEIKSAIDQYFDLLTKSEELSEGVEKMNDIDTINQTIDEKVSNTLNEIDDIINTNLYLDNILPDDEDMTDTDFDNYFNAYLENTDESSDIETSEETDNE